jgi:hypothetical protein
MKGFKMSRDYKLLWDLIHNDYRIPAWVDYDRSRVTRDKPLRDIVEVKRAYMREGYMIGTRGIGYEPCEQTFEAFKDTCKFHNLEFIVPAQSANN